MTPAVTKLQAFGNLVPAARSLANEIANKPHGTARFQGSQDRTIVLRTRKPVVRTVGSNPAPSARCPWPPRLAGFPPTFHTYPLQGFDLSALPIGNQKQCYSYNQTQLTGAGTAYSRISHRRIYRRRSWIDPQNQAGAPHSDAHGFSLSVLIGVDIDNPNLELGKGLKCSGQASLGHGSIRMQAGFDIPVDLLGHQGALTHSSRLVVEPPP